MNHAIFLEINSVNLHLYKGNTLIGETATILMTS